MLNDLTKSIKQNISYFNVSVSRTGDKELLLRVESHAFDCRVVCLEFVPLNPLSHIKHKDVSLFASGYKKLIEGRKQYSGGAVVFVTRE